MIIFGTKSCMLSILLDYVGFEMPTLFQIHKLKTLPDEVKSLSFKWKNVYKVFPMKLSVFCHNTNSIEIFWKNATYQISLRHTLKKEDCWLVFMYMLKMFLISDHVSQNVDAQQIQTLLVMCQSLVMAKTPDKRSVSDGWK